MLTSMRVGAGGSDLRKAAQSWASRHVIIPEDLGYQSIGAPRSMKMGTTLSPCRYDAARQATPQLAHVAKATRALYDGWGVYRNSGIASRTGFE